MWIAQCRVFLYFVMVITSFGVWRLLLMLDDTRKWQFISIRAARLADRVTRDSRQEEIAGHVVALIMRTYD